MGLFDLVFPKTCLGCDREGRYICDSCSSNFKLLKPACPYCERTSINGFTHTKCRKEFCLDGLTSVWNYEGVVKKAILALKYKYSTEVGKELSDLFIRQLQIRKDLPKKGTLIPIPIHWHKENVRGFNQSVEIGKFAAESMGWGFIPNLLIKNRPTVSQATLSVEERKKNIRGVFSLNSSISLLDFPSSIVLFDDVFTTGSTLKEAAKVLKKSRVIRVWGLTIAR